MGLGKTIQTIAFLLSLSNKKVLLLHRHHSFIIGKMNLKSLLQI
ncbi:hypothetical protein Q0Y04_15310 [Clostridioides difficile]|nr:hypothetical protein Q0Y04_15310 [Clostridioides difficile]